MRHAQLRAVAEHVEVAAAVEAEARARQRDADAVVDGGEAEGAALVGTRQREHDDVVLLALVGVDRRELDVLHPARVEPRAQQQQLPNVRREDRDALRRVADAKQHRHQQQHRARLAVFEGGAG